MIAAAVQAAPLGDPSTYPTSWGVLGALVVVILIMGRLILILFAKGLGSAQQREDKLLDFVSGHTDKTSQALASLGEKIQAGDNRVAGALEEHGRMMRAVLITVEGFHRARAVKHVSGKELTTAEIDQVIRAAHDAVRRGTG